MEVTANFEAARRNMVEYQIRCCKVLEPGLINMIESLPRENYLPENVRSLAYMEGQVPLPCGQQMLSPLQEASIVQALTLNGDERLLEIGSGTGFLTTMLAMQAGEVIGCEIHQELADLGRNNLESHGVSNATIIHLNAMDAEALAKAVSGKFDVIILTAAIDEIPEHIRAMLKESGQIVAFVGKNPVLSLVHQLYDGEICKERVLFETLLQDMEGLTEKREFIF